MKQATEQTELRELKSIDMLQIYPFSFAFVTSMIFMGAMVKMGYLAMNPSVQYWIGDWPTYIAFLPLAFVLLSYIIHRIAGGPSKLASLIGLLGPSIMLFVGGYKVSVAALSLSSAFSSADCITNPHMYKLGLEWDAAEAFKKTCTTPTIAECPGYKKELAKNPGWKYLAHLETTTGCGGWCQASTTLWLYPGAVQDPCSSAAGESLTTEVLYPAMQVAIYDIAILFLATVGMAVLGPKLSKSGVEW